MSEDFESSFRVVLKVLIVYVFGGCFWYAALTETCTPTLISLILCFLLIIYFFGAEIGRRYSVNLWPKAGLSLAELDLNFGLGMTVP